MLPQFKAVGGSTRAAGPPGFNRACNTITDRAVDVATTSTGGYPFLIQLVGFWMCKLADTTRDHHTVIDEAAAAAGVQAARRRLGSLIHEPAQGDLPEGDRTFLAAMAIDDGPSRMGVIAGRLNSDANYASQYRLRLIAADMIHSTGRGSSISPCHTCGTTSASTRNHRPVTKIP